MSYRNLLCSLLLLELRQLQTHMTADTPFHWAAVGQHRGPRACQVISWAGLTARWLPITTWVRQCGQRSGQHICTWQGDLTGTWRGPGILYNVVPLQRGGVVQVSGIDNCLFYWMVYRLISINCFWKSSKIGPGGHPLWWPVRGGGTDRLLASWRSQQAQSEGHHASRRRIQGWTEIFPGV